MYSWVLYIAEYTAIERGGMALWCFVTVRLCRRAVVLHDFLWPDAKTAHGTVPKSQMSQKPVTIQAKTLCKCLYRSEALQKERLPYF